MRILRTRQSKPGEVYELFISRKPDDGSVSLRVPCTKAGFPLIWKVDDATKRRYEQALKEKEKYNFHVAKIPKLIRIPAIILCDCGKRIVFNKLQKTCPRCGIEYVEAWLL